MPKDLTDLDAVEAGGAGSYEIARVAKGMQDDEEPKVITFHGEAVAALVSLDDLRAVRAAEDAADIAAIRASHASDAPPVSHEELMMEYGLR